MYSATNDRERDKGEARRGGAALSAIWGACIQTRKLAKQTECSPKEIAVLPRRKNKGDEIPYPRSPAPTQTAADSQPRSDPPLDSVRRPKPGRDVAAAAGEKSRRRCRSLAGMTCRGVMQTVRQSARRASCLWFAPWITFAFCVSVTFPKREKPTRTRYGGGGNENAPASMGIIKF